MSMNYGSKPTSPDSQVEGMTLKIYETIEEEFINPAIQQMNEAVRKGMKQSEAQKTINEMKKQMKVLSYAIAKGVIEHLREKAKVTVDVSVSINNSTVTTYPQPTPGSGSGTGVKDGGAIE